VTGSEVTVNNCTLQSNIGSGIHAESGSTVSVADSALRSNYRGINVDSSQVSLNGGVIVENNTYNGVAISGRSIGYFNGPSLSEENKIRNNGGLGINASFFSEAYLYGKNTIQNNALGGLQVAFTAYAQFNGDIAEDGVTPLATVIDGNGLKGIELSFASSALFIGPHKISNNGSGGQPSGYGILMHHNASLGLYSAAEVSNNLGPGISADGDSSMEVSGAKILNNSGDGVLLTHASTAEWVSSPDNVISGNHPAAIACDDSSVAYGAVARFRPINCKNLERTK
jgi:hypothetical protein